MVSIPHVQEQNGLLALRFMKHEGQGVAHDLGQAARWYRKAANQGFAAAQRKLGYSYEQGKGVPQDYREAVHWYRLAAEQGDVWGQYNLGAMEQRRKRSLAIGVLS